MNNLNYSNPQYWKWVIFYNNSSDDRLIVKKLSGLGWTFNFAHKKVYWFMAGFTIIVLLGVYFIK